MLLLMTFLIRARAKRPTVQRTTSALLRLLLRTRRRRACGIQRLPSSTMRFLDRLLDLTGGSTGLAAPAPSTWGLNAAPGKATRLNGTDLAPLTEQFGSPLHVVDLVALDANATAALAPLLRDGRGADVFSSYKTNPVPGVLRRLHDNGVGAEAISPYEVWLALELGVDPERIIYNGPAKSFESLVQAAEKGFALVNANSRSDLHRMAEAAGEAGRTMRAGVRVNLPHMWGGQFGIRHDSPDLTATISEGRNDDRLDLVGLHAHSGFALRDIDGIDLHVRAVLALCDQIRNDIGWHPSVLDLGGSLVVPTVGDQAHATASLADASRRMWILCEQHFCAIGLPMPSLVIEPGRALTGDTQFMLTTVLDVRPRDESGSVLVVLDAGVSLAEPVRGGGHRVFNLGRGGAETCRQRLVGPLATDDDTLIDEIELPLPCIGDVLAIMDAGAYFVPFSTAASAPRPAIVSIGPTGDIETLRQRESADHATSLDVV